MPLALALFTLLTLVLVYTIRPPVAIDMGGNYDSVYLRGFHGREIDANGASETFAWADPGPLLEVPGRREGVWIATIRLADDQPDDALQEVALAINDRRVSLPRRGARWFVATVPADIAAAETLRFELVPSVVGGPPPLPGVAGELTLAPARTYRWSSDEAAIVLPGLGRGAWQLDLDVVVAHPDGSPVNARVAANGVTLASLPESSTERRISLLVPARLVQGGDLAVTFRADTYADPRPLGLFVSDVRVTPVDGPAALTPAAPPWGTLAASLTVVLALYVCLAGILRFEPWSLQLRGAPAKGWTLLAILVLLGFGAWALTLHRFPTSLMLPRLAGLMVWSLLLLLLLRPLLDWAFQAVARPDATALLPAGTFAASQNHAGFLNLLLLAFFVSYWLKAGGMLYPFFVGIDIDWHMERSRWILNGQLPLLYSTNSPLNESTMPTAEWGENRPVIPYSPYFHMFGALLGLLPFDMSFSANMLSAVLDVSRVLLIALLIRAAGMTERAALLGGALYGFLPVTFLLHSWANIPTTSGMWWTLLAMTLLFVAWDRLQRPLIMVTLSLLLLVSFLWYTVTGVFLGFFLVVFTLLAWVTARRGAAGRAVFAGLKPLWQATGVAIVAALIIYYGQYIWPILAQTVPYFATVFTQGPESVGVERPSFGSYMLIFVEHLDYRRWEGGHLYYGVAIPLLFVVPGLLALWKRHLLFVLLAAWYTVGLVFMFVGYRISMVDKQLFFILPAMCVCWAVYAERYWLRGRWGRWFVLTIYAFTLASALGLWVFRIANSPVLP